MSSELVIENRLWAQTEEEVNRGAIGNDGAGGKAAEKKRENQLVREAWMQIDLPK